MNSQWSQKRFVVIVGLALVLLVAGATWVWAQTEDGPIYACVNPHDGTLYIVANPAECKKNETLLTWNIRGLACWDLNGDGVKDAAEDINGDGQWNTADCQGPQGEQGPEGPAGPQGETGPTGPTGPQGETGPAGPAGPQGETGPAGAQGETGATGATGQPGAPGVPGLACWDLDGDGVADPDEDVYPIGAPDGQWNTLDCKGPQGDQGIQGEQGLQGLPGEQGVPGEPGAPGAQGKPGLACWDLDGDGVADLEEDVNGDKVVDALDCQGPAGEPGADGAPGAPGADGADGLACWDLDGDGVADPEENVNGDAVVDVLDCQGPPGEGGWSLTGNAGTTPGTNYLGTSDDQPLEIKVNALRALRLEPNATSPNLIGGYSGNWVTSGVYGATIAGGGMDGDLNRVTDLYGTVGGGRGNQAGDNDESLTSGMLATVGGGYQNTASGTTSTVGGGDHNTASSYEATVGGGQHNTASGATSTVGGGTVNTAAGELATVGGGAANQASGWGSSVGGGEQNRASAHYSTVPGGHSNAAAGAFSFAAGRRAKANNTGCFVWADATDADFLCSTDNVFAVRATGGVNLTVDTGGGGLHIQPNAHSPNLIGGHSGNWLTSGVYGAAIGGGGAVESWEPTAYLNRVTDLYGTVGGGRGNQAGDNNESLTNAEEATVGGGYRNTASGSRSTVAGGFGNTASEEISTVGGGSGNNAGIQATVGGGLINQASGFGSSVGAGYQNIASGYYATVGAGYQNSASGSYATVPGGLSNAAAGAFSFAAGRRAKANNSGCFVWADATDADFLCSTDNVFAVRATGGVNLTADTGGGGLHIQPNATSPNLIGGHSGNSVTAGAYGTTIGGGGSSASPNRVTDHYGTVGGGEGNQAGDNAGATDDTRWATVGGGYQNTASGTKSTVGGGDHNTASGYEATVGGGYHNTASGATSTVGGGTVNTAAGELATVGGGAVNQASGWGSSVGGGEQNRASAHYATVGAGYQNTASGTFSIVGAGYQNTASGSYSTVPGGAGASAGLYGQMAYAGGTFAAAGDAQASLYVLRRAETMTAGTWYELFLDGGGARLTIASGRTVTFDMRLSARTSAGESAGYRIEGVIENVGGVTTLIGSPVVTVLGEDDTAWNAQVSADDTNDALLIQVQGNGETIRWVATVETAEVAW